MTYQGLKNAILRWKKNPKHEVAFSISLQRADSEKRVHFDWIPRPYYGRLK
jgi:hypothetical protein